MSKDMFDAVKKPVRMIGSMPVRKVWCPGCGEPLTPYGFNGTGHSFYRCTDGCCKRWEIKEHDDE